MLSADSVLLTVCGRGTPRNGFAKSTSFRVFIVTVIFTSVPCGRVDPQADGFAGQVSVTLSPLGVEPSQEIPYLLMMACIDGAATLDM